ncbi:MAG: LPS-assembly protein LptD [Armatimonadetes bacterium]|nr:LPS-assembly protein LptD [Armatimonadota bacterium]
MPALLGIPKLPPVHIQRAEPTVQQVDETFRVEWQSKIIDPNTGVLKFVGNVRAYYGPTVVSCDELEIHAEEKMGFARGNVHVFDPEGKLDANSLDFNWQARTGHAENVYLETAGMRGTVESIEISPDRWVLNGVYGTPSKRRVPDIAISTPKIVLRPGRSGRMAAPTVSLFGKKIVKLFPTSFSLDKRVEGFKWPSLNFKRKSGLGVSWTSGFLLNDQTALSAATNSFPDNLPSTTVALAWSKIPPRPSSGFIVPRSELDERFGNGYFNRIYVENPEDEADDLRRDKFTLGVLSSWNSATVGRLTDSLAATKPLEFVGELGGQAHGIGFQAQMRLQRVRFATDTPYTDRALVLGSAQLPPIRLSKNIALTARMDQLWAAGIKGQGFGWVRGEIGAIWSPTPVFRLGAAYARGKELGSAEYEVDRLFSRNAIHLRADVRLGNYLAGGLWKYDVQRAHWYDTEFSFSFVAGSFEPFVQARLFPREVRIGARFRVEEFFGKLSQRTFNRSQPGKK